MKHYYPKIVSRLLFAAMLFLISSCQQPDLLETKSVNSDALNTLLDKKQKANPFTAENIKRALSNVREKQFAKNGKAANCYECIPSTTHNYVRFAPQDIDQLITLHNYGYDLFDVPLDREVVTQGEYYQDQICLQVPLHTNTH